MKHHFRNVTFGAFFSFCAFASLVGVSAVAGCSSDESSTPDETTDAGNGEAAATADAAKDAASEGSATDAAKTDAGKACNTLANDAPAATTETVKGNAPAATGGTIAEGTYFQTAFTIYDPNGTASSPSPSDLKSTLRVKAGVIDTVVDLGDGENRTFSETFTVNGTKLERMLTCPKAAADLEAVYSVSGKNFIIFETDPQGGLVAGSTFVKQ